MFAKQEEMKKLRYKCSPVRLKQLNTCRWLSDNRYTFPRSPDGRRFSNICHIDRLLAGRIATLPPLRLVFGAGIEPCWLSLCPEKAQIIWRVNTTIRRTQEALEKSFITAPRVWHPSINSTLWPRATERELSSLVHTHGNSGMSRITVLFKAIISPFPSTLRRLLQETIYRNRV